MDCQTHRRTDRHGNDTGRKTDTQTDTPVGDKADDKQPTHTLPSASSAQGPRHQPLLHVLVSPKGGEPSNEDNTHVGNRAASVSAYTDLLD